MMIRKARLKDIRQIQKLINLFAKQDLMLPRSLSELFGDLRDFWVVEEDEKIVACCALHLCWDDLVEIKSLAVQRNKQKKGIGKRLVLACINEAKDLGANKVFVLTYNPDYFTKFGFKRVGHSELPHKIWSECINCPKFPDCQEVALVKQL